MCAVCSKMQGEGGYVQYMNVDIAITPYRPEKQKQKMMQEIFYIFFIKEMNQQRSIEMTSMQKNSHGGCFGTNSPIFNILIAVEH